MGLAVNQRLRRMGRYVPRETDWLDRDDLTEAEIREHMDAEGWQRVAAHLMEPPPTDNGWLQMQSINEVGKPRKGGRHRRQR
jgi:hypothetical protein